MGTGHRYSTSAATAPSDWPSRVAEPAPAPRADITVGVAVDTHNYQALMRRSEADHRASFEHFDARGRRSEPIAMTNTNTNSSNVAVGLPLQTGNYAALLAASGCRESISTPREKLPCVAETTVATTVCESEFGLVGVQVDEDEGDAVLGLPISTGNYEAMFVQENDKKLRQRGYSDLARESGTGTSTGNGRGALRFSQSNSNSGNRSGSQSRSATGTKRMPNPARESIFDGRRSCTAASLPHRGWLWIQSPTRKFWKRYYAVLSGFEFRYSKERAQAPIGFALLQTVNAWSGKPHGLAFISAGGAPIHAYCEDDDQRDQWVMVMTNTLEKRQNLTGQSKTAYTLSNASDSHDGYLYRRSRSREWCRCFFSMRNDGYLVCRETKQSQTDARFSGYVQSVTFAEIHPNGLAIQLDSGISLLVHAESYDERMLWYAVIAAGASANDARAPPTTAMKTSYVETVRPNHAGWLQKQQGIFKAWKRVYVTLHGIELGCAKDANAPLDEVERVFSVKDWDGQLHGLQIVVASGQVWKVRADSYETAKQWRNMINDSLRRTERMHIRGYLASCKRKQTEPVFGGWLTTAQENLRLRRFYVMDGNRLGVADEVDNLLRPIGSIVDVGAIRTITNGMLFVFADGSQLKVAGDSVDSAKAWYDCLSASL